MNRPFRVLIALLLFGLVASTATAVLMDLPGQLSGRTLLAPQFPVIDDTPIREELPILRGDTLDSVLRRASLDPVTQFGLAQAVITAVDVRKLRAGDAFLLTRTALREPRALEYQIDHDSILHIDIPEPKLETPSFPSTVQTIPSSVATVPICATLESSLFESIDQAGESPELAIRMAELFAWDLDFYTDPQNGDTFCLLVEKRSYENGQQPTYGKIHAATYKNMGKMHDAFLFQDKEGKPVYFSSDGQSTQAAFLRSPLKFAARISSRFSHSRLHPVLKIRRPHLGIDYAAPTGTPVQAIAAGTVTFSGRSGGAGNLIKLRHANGFESYYMHLSRRQVKAGQKIDQGQQIGLVGSTGLSTGPHLDFRIRKHGKYLNFERLDLPRQSSVHPSMMAAFKARRGELLAMLGERSARNGEVVASAQPTADSVAAPN
ncbi:MAG: peptidoglycan DD-metalloendopeptidase family protein [Bryobacterales bacterium]|nr:peptidoglycan DD-metalloendopeptidase family protein [Bryobacterales bacterium]